MKEEKLSGVGALTESLLVFIDEFEHISLYACEIHLFNFGAFGTES